MKYFGKILCLIIYVAEAVWVCWSATQMYEHQGLYDTIVLMTGIVLCLGVVDVLLWVMDNSLTDTSV